MSLRNLETRGNATLFLTVYGPNLQGKTKFEQFLKFKKCSSSTMSFGRINSKQNILGVRKAGRMYGECTKLYCLMVVPNSERNQSRIFLPFDNCSICLILGNTLGSLSWKKTSYIQAINWFMNLLWLVAISVVTANSGSYMSSSLWAMNILSRKGQNLNVLASWKFVN